MRFALIPALGAAFAMSGCIQNLNTHSSFTTLSQAGTLGKTLGSQSKVTEIDSDGDGFASISGTRSSTGLEASSGFVVTSALDPLPTTDSATYSGTYEISTITSIYVSGDSIFGLPGVDRGSIDLNVDFDAASISGSTGNLSVDGEFSSGGNIDGNVTYRGVSGDLAGQIGGNKAIGAFHGNDADLIYAGGFLVYDN